MIYLNVEERAWALRYHHPCEAVHLVKGRGPFDTIIRARPSTWFCPATSRLFSALNEFLTDERIAKYLPRRPLNYLPIAYQNAIASPCPSPSHSHVGRLGIGSQLFVRPMGIGHGMMEDNPVANVTVANVTVANVTVANVTVANVTVAEALIPAPKISQ